MIFIIEDDEATRDSLRLLLECEGFEVSDFATASGFRSRHRPRPGDCLILDLNLPGIGGLELLEDLRREGNPVPVILITGRPTPANRRRAEQLGALAMLEKPYEADTLLDLVRQARPHADHQPCRC
jgi:two-component system, LuxR family, response regulator FixJ